MRASNTSGLVVLHHPPGDLIHDLRPALPAWCGLWCPADGEFLAATEAFAVAIVPIAGEPIAIGVGEAIAEKMPAPLGSVALISAGTPFQLRIQASSQLLVLGFDERLIRAGAMPALARRDGHYELRSGIEPKAEGCATLAGLLAAELSAASDAARRAALTLTLIEFFAGLENLVSRREAASAFVERRIERVIELIDAHIASPLSLAWLAKEAGISPFHLSRCFREALGVNVNRYVRERRLHFACKLLAETRKPLAEIAYDSGFSSQSRMNMVFRVVMDMTPLAYRRKCWRTPARSDLETV